MRSEAKPVPASKNMPKGKALSQNDVTTGDHASSSEEVRPSSKKRATEEEEEEEEKSSSPIKALTQEELASAVMQILSDVRSIKTTMATQDQIKIIETTMASKSDVAELKTDVKKLDKKTSAMKLLLETTASRDSMLAVPDESYVLDVHNPTVL